MLCHSHVRPSHTLSYFAFPRRTRCVVHVGNHIINKWYLYDFRNSAPRTLGRCGIWWWTFSHIQCFFSRTTIELNYVGLIVALVPPARLLLKIYTEYRRRAYSTTVEEEEDRSNEELSPIFYSYFPSKEKVRPTPYGIVFCICGESIPPTHTPSSLSLV